MSSTQSSTHPSPSIYETVYQLIMTMPLADGEISPNVLNLIRAVETRNIQVMLAYPPKVGGTFMRVALVELLKRHYASGLSRGSYANTDGAREPYFPLLLQQHIVQGERPRAAVMHLHTYPLRHVTEMIEAFNIPVIIAVRDILDTLVSGIDMLDRAEAKGEAIDDALIHNGKSYLDMSPAERRRNFVNVVPLWYARFYGQWLEYGRQCTAAGRRAPLWLQYNDFAQDPGATLSQIARYVDPGHIYSTLDIRSALHRAGENKEKARFNKGVSGRGDAYFTAAEKARIYELLAPAGLADLERLGVLTPAYATMTA